MASDKILLAVQKELEYLQRVPFAELVDAVSGAKGFYDEGDIPLPEKK